MGSVGRSIRVANKLYSLLSKLTDLRRMAIKVAAGWSPRQSRLDCSTADLARKRVNARASLKAITLVSQALCTARYIQSPRYVQKQDRPVRHLKGVTPGQACRSLLDNASVDRSSVALEHRARVAEFQLDSPGIQYCANVRRDRGSVLGIVQHWLRDPGDTHDKACILCRVRAIENDTDLTEEELEEKMEQFMRNQADRESGKPAL